MRYPDGGGLTATGRALRAGAILALRGPDGAGVWLLRADGGGRSRGRPAGRANCLGTAAAVSGPGLPGPAIYQSHGRSGPCWRRGSSSAWIPGSSGPGASGGRGSSTNWTRAICTAACPRTTPTGTSTPLVSSPRHWRRSGFATWLFQPAVTPDFGHDLALSESAGRWPAGLMFAIA